MTPSRRCHLPVGRRRRPRQRPTTSSGRADRRAHQRRARPAGGRSYRRERGRRPRWRRSCLGGGAPPPAGRAAPPARPGARRPRGPAGAPSAGRSGRGASAGRAGPGRGSPVPGRARRPRPRPGLAGVAPLPSRVSRPGRRRPAARPAHPAGGRPTGPLTRAAALVASGRSAAGSARGWPAVAPARTRAVRGHVASPPPWQRRAPARRPAPRAPTRAAAARGPGRSGRGSTRRLSTRGASGGCATHRARARGGAAQSAPRAVSAGGPTRLAVAGGRRHAAATHARSVATSPASPPAPSRHAPPPAPLSAQRLSPVAARSPGATGASTARVATPRHSQSRRRTTATASRRVTDVAGATRHAAPAGSARPRRAQHREQSTPGPIPDARDARAPSRHSPRSGHGVEHLAPPARRAHASHTTRSPVSASSPLATTSPGDRSGTRRRQHGSPTRLSSPRPRRLSLRLVVSGSATHTVSYLSRQDAGPYNAPARRNRPRVMITAWWHSDAGTQRKGIASLSVAARPPRPPSAHDLASHPRLGPQPPDAARPSATAPAHTRDPSATRRKTCAPRAGSPRPAQSPAVQDIAALARVTARASWRRLSRRSENP